MNESREVDHVRRNEHVDCHFGRDGGAPDQSETHRHTQTHETKTHTHAHTQTPETHDTHPVYKNVTTTANTFADIVVSAIGFESSARQRSLSRPLNHSLRAHRSARCRRHSWPSTVIVTSLKVAT